jgi:hypothetical protein
MMVVTEGQLTLKVVINHYRTYTRPLETLLASLVRVNATSSTILIGGGYAHETQPQVRDVCGCRLVLLTGDYSNYDYHAFRYLRRYQGHALIKADGYLMIHDTVVALPGFPGISADVFRSYAIVRTSGALHSNIFAFSRTALSRFPSIPVFTKAEAIQYEQEQRLFRPFNDTEILHLPRRTCPSKEDVYHTGHARHRCTYPAFHLLKFFAHRIMGDVEGNARPNGIPCGRPPCTPPVSFPTRRIDLVPADPVHASSKRLKAEWDCAVASLSAPSPSLQHR